MFKVGNKVNVTKSFLINLPFLTDKVKDGGVITYLWEDDATIKFYSGYGCHVFYKSLELVEVKGRQLEFAFMRTND